jgi:hypothetical protein
VKGEQVRTRDRMCVRLHMPTGGGCGHVLLPAPAMQQRQPATSCISTVYGVQGKGRTLGHYGHNTCTDNHASVSQQGRVCPCAGCHPPHTAANLASCGVWGGAIRAPGLPVRGQSGAGSRQKDCATAGAGCWQAVSGACAAHGRKRDRLAPVDNSASDSRHGNAQKTGIVDKCCKCLICLNIPDNVRKVIHSALIYDGRYVK